jgi:hypothetical protein
MKQSRCPTTDERIKKMWYINTVELYSAIRKNETMWLEGEWMELEDIILSEINQVQKDKGCRSSLICGRQIQKINVTKANTIIYTFIC